MKAVYNNVATTIVPTEAEFKTASALSWYQPRSAALARQDGALRTIEQQPTTHTFAQIEQAYTAWRNTKLDPATASAVSKRGASANALVAQVQAHRRVLNDRTTLMRRVETLIATSDWQRKCLCAELYNPARGPWGVLDPYVAVLEQESILSSGWAKNAPGNLAGWSANGASDLDTVQRWPNLAFKTRIILQSQLGIAAWPPWPGAMHVRKGLFCHSSAAIAAHLIDSNRLVLQGGLACPIRSIDIVQQLPVTQGGISHWWVAVNRPDVVRLSNNRTVPFGTVGDFNWLPLLGGFVVDVWGALWIDQLDDAATQAVSPAASAGDAVRDAPFISLGDNLATEAVRVAVHHVY